MRDVAIIATAQTKHVRAATATNEVEMIQPVIQEVIERSGVGRHDFDFTCSGSSDYLAGQPFSFVMTLDAVAAWPPISESHVEMDGAWALYEAWVKIQTGHADTALVYSYGKSSPGDLPLVLSRMTDPYYEAPLWPTSIDIAALQARAAIQAGVTSEQAMADIAYRSRSSAAANPFAQLQNSAQPSALMDEEYLADPLRKHDCAPITDGGVAIVLAAGDKARALCSRPAWIRGIDHRADGHHLNLRDLTTSPSVSIAAEKAGVANGPIEVAELHTCFTHHEPILRAALGLGDDVEVNPSGGPLAANPMMAAGLLRMVEVANRIHSGEVSRGVAHATGGHALQHNLVAVLEGEG
ncbi:MAG: thiolase domain-containing protein [Microthrixaceae bacterium]